MATSGTSGRPAPGPAALRGVLWDLDGTVVDSEPAWYAAEVTLVERYGGTWSKAQALALVGSDLHDTAAGLQAAGVPIETGELINLMLDLVIERVMASQPWLPGVPQALAACQAAGWSNALVSMSWRRFTHAVAALAPGAFAVVVSGDDVVKGKPDPEAYLTGAAKLGCAPEECIAVEDSPTGAASALAAGIPTVVVPGAATVPPRPGLINVSGADAIKPDWLRLTHAKLLAQLHQAASDNP
ncbi:MAG: HAD family phosphatase [Bifidobacteriaceae bacterium]|jgi:HAD superfamily hydrolase (TIGR01509 family)|nr:HAD family phosphatase [Bifidobacteriaceae bacterium]